VAEFYSGLSVNITPIHWWIIAPVFSDKTLWMKQIRNWKVDGKLLLDISTPQGRAKADELVGLFEKIGPLNPENELEPALEFRKDILARTGRLKLITDDNMGAEW